jgi:dolichol-phosphate mannosyltransferase
MHPETSISIVGSTFNEEAIIADFIERTLNILEKNFQHYELILIDDGSTDKTFQICQQYADKNPHIRAIAFSRNYGHEIALTAGIEYAKNDYVVLLDTDLQHPPELIPQLMEKILTGYDIVYAARTSRAGETWFKKMSTKLYYYLARKMSGLDFPSDAGNFRIINRKVVQSIRQLKEHNRHLMMLYAYVGFRTTSIPYICEPRKAGASKYSYRKLINLALDSIISFSQRPLRYMSIGSIVISVVMSCYAGFILLQKLFYNQHLAEGLASLIFVISSLFAILFLFLAVISEYIGRILTESKNRPLYYIREDSHQKQDIQNETRR